MDKIHGASAAEFTWHALDHAIRETVKDLRWARHNKWLGCEAYYREQRLRLRTLCAVRSEGRRNYREHQRSLRRVWFEVHESAKWRRADLNRELPDLGDHFAEAQA